MLIGVVGNIAAGKSTVISELKNMNMIIIKYDDVATQTMRELWEPVSNNKLSKLINVPNDMFSEDNKVINDTKLGNILFGDYKLLKLIDSILSPISISKINTLIEASRHKSHIALESALLIEHGIYKQMDKIILVKTDDEIRKARLMKRNNFSEEKAMIRMLAQSSQEYKLKFADYVIDNSFSLENTKHQIYEILKCLRIEVVK